MQQKAGLKVGYWDSWRVEKSVDRKAGHLALGRVELWVGELVAWSAVKLAAWWVV